MYTKKRQCLYKCYCKEQGISTNFTIGSSLFDLIGTKEPDQTKSLGYVLSRSEIAMKLFLTRVIGKNHAKELMECDCIVTCEQQLDSGNDTIDRADIVIRFPRYNEIIIVEAKGLNAKTKAEDAVQQAIRYAERMKYNKCAIVSLTNSRNYYICDRKGYTIVALQWIDIVDDFDTIVRTQKNNDVSLEKDFLNYLLKISGLMNYYDIEVLSIPAGDTIEGVEKAHVYKCSHEKNKSRGEHKPLFIAFREKGGVVKKLYKVENLISIPIEGEGYENVKDQLEERYRERIDNYKKITHHDGKDQEHKWVFFLDEEKSIDLPNPVKYEINPQGIEIRRPLKDYFSTETKEINGKKYVVFKSLKGAQ